MFNIIEIFLVFIILLLFFVIFLLIRRTADSQKTISSNEIQELKKDLDNIYEKTLEQSGSINSKIEEIGQLTKKMTNAMSSNISDMGSFGEIILERILEECNLTRNRDYKLQYYGENQEGKIIKPDVVVFLPENRNLIVDSKAPLKHWYAYQNTDDKETKDSFLKQFIASLKGHINEIYKKEYSSLYGINSPDHVFIFLPHEISYFVAQKFDKDLIQYAFERKINIVGPSTIMMCLKLVESIWRTENQHKNSSKIAVIAGQMYDQIVKAISILENSEANLTKAHESVSQAKKYIKEGRGSLFDKAEKMRELGAENKKELKHD